MTRQKLIKLLDKQEEVLFRLTKMVAELLDSAHRLDGIILDQVAADETAIMERLVRRLDVINQPLVEVGVQIVPIRH